MTRRKRLQQQAFLDSNRLILMYVVFVAACDSAQDAFADVGYVRVTAEEDLLRMRREINAVRFRSWLLFVVVERMIAIMSGGRG